MECNKKLQKLTCADEDFLVLVEGLMSSLEEEDLLLVAAICKGIWFQMNKFIFEGVFTQPSQVVSKAKEAVKDFYQASLE